MLWKFQILKTCRTFKLEPVGEMQECILEEEDAGAPLIPQQVC